MSRHRLPPVLARLKKRTVQLSKNQWEYDFVVKMLSKYSKGKNGELTENQHKKLEEILAKYPDTDVIARERKRTKTGRTNSFGYNCKRI